MRIKKLINKFCLILLCLLMPYFAVFAGTNVTENSNDAVEKAQLRKTLESKTFAELEQKARDNLKQLENDKEQPPISLKISSTSADTNEYSDAISFPDKQLIEATFNQDIAKIQFEQKIYGDHSKIYLSDTDLRYKLDNYQTYRFEDPIVLVTKAYLIDGSELPINIDANGQYVVNSNKQIISLELDVKYSVPKNPISKLTFSDKLKIHDTISLTSIENDTVTLSMPEKVWQTILAVEGLDVQGKTLASGGQFMWSSNPKLRAREKLFHQKLVQNIDNKLIKDKESLIDYVIEHFSELNDNNTDVTVAQAQYSFGGHVDSVNVYLKAEPDIIHYQIKTTLSLTEYVNNLTIASDKNSNKQGIISAQGEWIIPPRFSSIYNKVGNYYDTYINENGKEEDAIYLLDIKNKKFIKQPFFIRDADVYQNRFVIINQEPDNNFVKGLVDIKTDKIIFSLKYDSIKVTDYFILTDQYNKNKKQHYYEIFNIKNNQKIYSGNERITFYADKFMIQKETCTQKEPNYYDYYQDELGYCYNQYNLYSINGKKMNNKAFTRIEGEFSASNLLLVSINQDYFVINQQGKTVNINLRDYEQVKPFSEGLSAVQCRSNELYGYINEQGKLIIPCIYQFANNFQAGSAMVKDEQYQLIKPDNSIIKQFTENYLYTYSAGQDSTTPTYTFWVDAKDDNAKDSYITYDHKGEVVTKNNSDN